MCGNWGLLCILNAAGEKNNTELFPKTMEKLLLKMLEVVQLRGAQAGGVNTMVTVGGDVEAIRARVTKPKRGELGTTIFKEFAKALSDLKWSTWFSASPRTICLGQGHSRFGTSSVPQVNETHPHRWSHGPGARGGYMRKFWSWSPEKDWTRVTRNMCVTITHNGDFDAWKPYKESTVDVGLLAKWIAKIVGDENPAAGDSPKFAGLMEILICKGVWFNAVRFAYHTTVACHVEQVTGWRPLEDERSPRNCPTDSMLDMWAAAFDKEFEELLERLSVKGMVKVGPVRPMAPDSASFEGFVENVVARIQQGESGKALEKWVPHSKVSRFCRVAAEAFRDNDLLAAATIFFGRADGTFGISISCTLWPELIVIGARGQPMSVGLGGDAGGGRPSIALWTSEPASLNALAHGGLKSGNAVRVRFDLDDRGGEVLQLSVEKRAANNEEEEERARQEGRFRVELGAVKGVSTGIAVKPADGEMIEAIEACGVRLGSFEVLSPESFEGRLMHLDEDHQAYENPTGDQGQGSVKETHRESTPEAVVHASKMKKEVFADPVVQDIAHTPMLIHEIDLTWADKKSLNCLSAKKFSQMLVDRMKNRPLCPPGKVKGIDLLVVGVENSLWMGQQFLADLTRCFPSLYGVAMSSNVVLGLLLGATGHTTPYNWVYSKNNFRITKNTIALIVSQSGTTYPTVWAARKVFERTPNVFGLSASFDNLLSVSIGQSASSAFTKRLFSTCSGLRGCEASTAATMCMHHTLSHLVVFAAAYANEVRLPTMLQNSRYQIVDGHAEGAHAAHAAHTEGLNLDNPEEEEDSNKLRICIMTKAEIRDMQRIILSLYFGVAAVCGRDPEGTINLDDPQTAKYRNSLISAGQRWSHHVTESYYATFLPAIYVAITVTLSVPPIISIGNAICKAADTDCETPYESVWWWLFHAGDAFIYVFLGIITACIHRLMTGRKFWARFTTRVLLVCESTMNYKLLRAYASKLRALSWRFATVAVMGHNGTDHLVHEYTHLANSDVLVAAGLPDGRLATAARAEACILMSMQQAKFIKGQGRGVEIYGLGHNPFTRPNLFRLGLKLPTSRPLFASEQMLFKDQFPAKGEANDLSHQLAPTEVLQRCDDLLHRDLDPSGAPQLRLSSNELVSMVGIKKTEGHGQLDIDTCEEVIDKLLRKQKEETKDESEDVPLGIRRFLTAYFAEDDEGPRAEVVNRDQPKKEEPKKDEKNGKKEPSEPEKVPESKAGAAPMDMRHKLELIAAGELEEGGDHGDNPAFSKKLSRRLSQAANADAGGGGGGGDDDGEPNFGRQMSRRLSHAANEMGSSGEDPSALIKKVRADAKLKPYIETNDFLALIHGDELKNWIKGVKFRWERIKKIRGVLTLVAKELNPRDPGELILYGGTTMGGILAHWRAVVPHKEEHHEEVGEVSVLDAAASEAKNRKNRKIYKGDKCEKSQAKKNKNSGVVGHHAVPIGQDFLDQAMGSKIFERMRNLEAFYEARVGSTERLMGWYVLMYEMIKPSTQLPVLSYEIGVSESRLRVASTPAPQAYHPSLIIEPMDDDKEDEKLIAARQASKERQVSNESTNGNQPVKSSPPPPAPVPVVAPPPPPPPAKVDAGFKAIV